MYRNGTKVQMASCIGIGRPPSVDENSFELAYMYVETVNLNVLHFAVTKTNGMDLFVIKFEISFGALLGTINRHHISTDFMHKFM
jgi:hypothetical protein